MEQFKRAKVIMLPTENPSNIITDSTELMYLYEVNDDQNKWGINRHLYIISDDEIKEGDYGMGFALGINSIEKGHYIFKNDNSKVAKLNILCEGSKKIIATTDTSLTKNIRMLCKSCKGSGGGFSPKCTACKGSGIRIEHDLLSQPSQQFIEKYIESYNKGEVITDVLVEYEEYERLDHPNMSNWTQLKVNPRDNTITIKKLKDSWNREQLLKAMIWAEDNAGRYTGDDKVGQLKQFNNYIDNQI